MQRPGDDDVIEEADVQRDEDGRVAHTWGRARPVRSPCPDPQGRSCLGVS